MRTPARDSATTSTRSGTKARPTPTIEGEDVRIVRTGGDGETTGKQGRRPDVEAPSSVRAMRPSEAAYRSGLFGTHFDAPAHPPRRAMPEPAEPQGRQPDLAFANRPGRTEAIFTGRQRTAQRGR